MEHYVTLFDSVFIPQGLALHMSMERHIKDFTLWIVCVDDDAYEVLSKLRLTKSRLLQLSKLETEDLVKVKQTRSSREYCWTLTPFAPRFVFEFDGKVDRVTYIDADLWFRKDPKPIFNEFEASGKQVLITDHAYAPEYDQSNISGQYCVQFVTFNRQGGEIVRKWWEERCLEWCHAWNEDGKFGDQKYLEQFLIKFDTIVHVLENVKYILAPWNATIYPYSTSLAYHFHGTRIFNEKVINTTSYHIPKPTVREIYKPYESDLIKGIRMLEAIGCRAINQTDYITAVKCKLRGLFFR